MSHSYHNGFYHFVWSTWDRQPLLTEDIESHAYALIRQQCQLMKVKIVALGGLSDHVHLLVTVPTTLCLADFMENVKGATCHTLNKAYAAPSFSFKWQRGYSYHTVSASNLGIVRRYIEQQKHYHDGGRLWHTCETPQNPSGAEEMPVVKNTPAQAGSGNISPAVHPNKVSGGG